jgi:hypothetical protein
LCASDIVVSSVKESDQAMTLFTLLRTRLLHGALVGGCLLLAAIVIWVNVKWLPSVADAAPVEANPARVMGDATCRACHKPIVTAWRHSRHASHFEKLADNPKARKYAAALGMSEASITRDGLCVRCHGQRALATATRTTTGVSCESCHGAAGGEKGWLNLHGSYGVNGLTREEETPDHKKMRHKLVKERGMLRPAQVYAMAKACLGCHTVPNEQLINVAGHKNGSANFELSSWVAGDVAHNLFLDPTKNAQAPSLWMAETGRTPTERKRMLYLLGQLADLEVSLRNLAVARKEGAFSQAMANRIKLAAGNLDDIKEIVPELVTLADAYKKIKLKLKPQHHEALLKVADKVAGVADTVETKHDGTKLKELDDVIPKAGNGVRYVPPK